MRWMAGAVMVILAMTAVVDAQVCAHAKMANADFWLPPGWTVDTAPDGSGAWLDRFSSGTVTILFEEQGPDLACKGGNVSTELAISYEADSSTISTDASGRVEVDVCGHLLNGLGERDVWAAVIVADDRDAMTGAPAVVSAVVDGLRGHLTGGTPCGGAAAGAVAAPVAVAPLAAVATADPNALHATDYVPGPAPIFHDTGGPPFHLARIDRDRLGALFDVRGFDGGGRGYAIGAEFELAPLPLPHAPLIAYSLRGAIARESGASVGDAALELGVAIPLGRRAQLYALLVAGFDVVATETAEPVGAILGGARGLLRISLTSSAALELEVLPLDREGGNEWRAAARLLLPRRSLGAYLELHHHDLGAAGAIDGLVLGISR